MLCIAVVFQRNVAHTKIIMFSVFLFCSQSENEDLQKGDVIKKIDEYDVRDLRHVDAQNLLQNSEFVKLAIERSESFSSRSDASTTRNHSPRIISKFVVEPSPTVASVASCPQQSQTNNARIVISRRCQDAVKFVVTRLSEQLFCSFF